MSVSVIESAPATTRDHYHFDGWYSSASLEEASKISFPYTPTANVTLYAKWTQTEFYVTYETNEGSSVSGGWAETIDSAPFTTRPGYDFTGWYTNEDLSADSLVEFPFTPTKDTVLYAGWKKAVILSFYPSTDSSSKERQQQRPPRSAVTQQNLISNNKT